MTSFARLRRMNHGSQFRAFGLHEAELTDPFLGIDHAWMSGPTFPPHPHAGFSAVSYLFLDSETWINNRDSLGGRQEIRPGGLHWTAAGRGVVHEENPAEVGKTVHMLQIFVNLPQGKQGDAPFALALAPQDVPVVNLPGAKVRIPLGEYAGQQSPLHPPTDVRLLDISLDDGAELNVPVPAGHAAFVLPIFGSVVADGELLDSDGAPVPVAPASPDVRVMQLRATHGPAKVALFSGEPLNQSVYRQGPMALASIDALNEAMSAYQRGDFGRI